MEAVGWQGPGEIEMTEVPDPVLLARTRRLCG
jgi:hypothetical protein